MYKRNQHRQRFILASHACLLLAYAVYYETEETDSVRFISLLIHKVQQQEPALYDELLLSAQRNGKMVDRVMREMLAIGLYGISKEAAASWLKE